MIDTNGDSNLFVGRDQEQETFCSLLEDVKGKVILVAGSASMGKSMLLKKMMQLAEHQSAIQCTCVSYQITPTDGIDSLMLEIIGDVADVAVSYAGEIKRLANQNKQKLSALFSAVGVIPAVGKTLEALGKLLLSLAEEARQSGNARQKLRQILEILSGRLPAQGRFIVFIDPEKLMPDNSADVWRLVLDNLPEKILFVFAQRPEDVLIGNSDFTRMGNVYRVPADVLEKFSSQEVDELIELRKRQISTGITDKQIRECLERYDGHPFSVQAAMSLLTEGVRPNELPDRPEPSKFAQTIIKTIEQKRDIDALSFLEAAAIIEIPRSKEIIAEVAGLSEKQGRIVLADRFMGGLFRKEVKGYRIYHIILADEVLKRISEKTRKEYHCRTAGVYRRALAEAERSESYPDETSLERLPVHVKVGEGEAAFVACFVNECQSLLRRLGLLDLHIKFSEQCLEIVEGDSVEQAAMLTNLGLVYQTRGEFDKAEGMYQKSLAISEQLGRKEGMAIQYGNLGNIYQTRGELDKAEEVLRKSLAISEQLGRKEGMAIQYGNLGGVYQARGELDKAEDMYRKSLAISEQLGRKDGMAIQYGNLGNIYRFRGELDKAEEMCRKSLMINEQLGHKREIAIVYGYLGSVYQFRGEFDKAEGMYQKSLAIDKQLGRKEGMANQYGNLGIIYQIRRELDKAEECWQKAMALFTQIGANHNAEKVRLWISSMKEE